MYRPSGILPLLVSIFYTLASAITEDANATLSDISSLYLSVDADCLGYEGQWNCLSDKFQHCSAGKWTAALGCSSAAKTLADVDQPAFDETICAPLGRTDVVDFQGECNAAWGVSGGGGWSGGNSGGGGVRCNSNRCYYGAGSNLKVEGWAFVFVLAVAGVGFFLG